MNELTYENIQALRELLSQCQIERDQLERAIQVVRENHETKVKNLKWEIELEHSAWKQRDKDYKNAQKEVARLRERWQEQEARLESQLEHAVEKWHSWKNNSYALEQRLTLIESQLKEERRRAVDAESRIIEMTRKDGN
jgi:chromosome segregation ATPase